MRVCECSSVSVQSFLIGHHNTHTHTHVVLYDRGVGSVSFMFMFRTRESVKCTVEKGWLPWLQILAAIPLAPSFPSVSQAACPVSRGWDMGLVYELQP